MKTHSKPKWNREYIYLHEKETPLLIRKLYHAHNKPDVCIYCNKKSEFLGIEIHRGIHVKIFKFCRSCLERFAKS